MKLLKLFIILSFVPVFSTCSLRSSQSQPSNSNYSQSVDFAKIDKNKDAIIDPDEAKLFNSSKKEVNSKSPLVVMIYIVGITLLLCFGHQIYSFFKRSKD